MAGRMRPQDIPPGQLLTYYGDIASGTLRPEDVKIEGLRFRAVIDASGQIQDETGKITIVSRYNFAFRGVWASIMLPGIAGAAPDLISFNVREQGRNFNIFKQAIGFGACLANPYHWDGVYICIPGTDLDIEWSVNTTLWPVLVGASKIVEVELLGDYIACNPTQE